VAVQQEIMLGKGALVVVADTPKQFQD